MALPNTNISIGNAPLLWSNMREALDKINANFTALDLATGGTAVDLTQLTTPVSPKYPNDQPLGSNTNPWKSVYTAGWADTIGDNLNGVWTGGAQIKGKEELVDTGYGPVLKWVVDLPVGSMVNGKFLVDLDTLKTVVADSTSFADFQTRIAAL